MKNTKTIIIEPEITNRFVIQKISNCPLFMADRNKTKKFWWTYLLCYAMIFTSEKAAIEKKDSFKYGTFKVITLSAARRIRERADLRHDEKMDKIDYHNNYDPGDSEYWDNSDNFHSY